MPLPPPDNKISPADSSNLGNPELLQGLILTWADGNPDARCEDKVLGILRMLAMSYLHTCLEASECIISELGSRRVWGEGIK
jgi:hypothetical protein